MFNYLKERFAEYMSLSEKTKVSDTPKIHNHPRKEDPYVDYEILYSGTDVIVDSFSMSRKEIVRNFEGALRRNLSEVLEVHAGNIRILSKKEDTIYCDITYSGKDTQYIRHEIREIKNKQPLFNDDDDIYNDLDEMETAYNPYKDGPWGETDWFCIRCGFSLMPIARDHDFWGEWVWENMLRDKTQWFLCTNKECFHSNGPLILHHPHKYDKPAGDSYSVSWIK